MLCPACGGENKETAKSCKKCSFDLAAPPPWMPSWRWHLKTLGILYVCLTMLFFGLKYLLRRLPPPYHIREIPQEMTPWLHPEKKPAPPQR
ncbi:MAG: hypothetical protein HY402_02495 [Elusimicrobia bacterium]|nr:hypothetical protein [Elusimicrobiota bacterium]